MASEDQKEEKKSEDPPAQSEQQNGNEETHGYRERQPIEIVGGGLFRGIAASFRSMAGFKAGVRAIGQARPLAFTSEVGVAAKSQIPKGIYYGAWGLSGIALVADISTKCMDAPEDKKINTAAYWTAFHIPASLVIPAVIIHKVVHSAEHFAKSPTATKYIPKTARPYVPVACALAAVVPVVPIVDHVMEMVFEPTLGEFLGVEFEHHHGDHADDEDVSNK